MELRKEQKSPMKSKIFNVVILAATLIALLTFVGVALVPRGSTAAILDADVPVAVGQNGRADPSEVLFRDLVQKGFAIAQEVSKASGAKVELQQIFVPDSGLNSAFLVYSVDGEQVGVLFLLVDGSWKVNDALYTAVR